MGTVDTCLFHTFRCVARDHDVSNLHSSDSFSNGFHNSSSLMSKNTRETSFGVTSVESIDIGMTEGIRDDLNSDLTLFGSSNPDIFDGHRFFCFVGNCSLAENGLRTFFALHRYVKDIPLCRI